MIKHEPFDHHAEEPTRSRVTARFPQDVREVDGHSVEVTLSYEVDYIYLEPHTASCEYAFKNADGTHSRTEVIVDVGDHQNPVFQNASVEVDGKYMGTFHEHPSDATLAAAVATYDAEAKAYQEAVARTSHLAAMRNDSPGVPLGVDAAEVGQTAWVHAKGKWRRGRVSKVGRSRVTVEYYVASSGTVTEKAGTARRPVRTEEGS